MNRDDTLWENNWYEKLYRRNEMSEEIEVIDPKETPYALITASANVNLIPRSDYKRTFHKTVKEAQERATVLLTQNRMQKIFIVKVVAEVSLAPPPVVVKKFGK